MRKRHKQNNERLVNLMEDFNFSGKQLSEFLGLNQSRTYNRIEGTTKFTRDDENLLLKKIGTYFKDKLELLRNKYLIY